MTTETTAMTEKTETTAAPGGKPKGAKKAKTNGKGSVKAKGAKPKGAKGKGKAKGAAKARKDKPTTGQSAPAIDLKVEELNAKETKVLDALNGKGEGPREPASITDLTKVFKNSAATKAQANSWVRNSLRRLVVGGFIEKVERGEYRVTERGRKRLQRAEA